MELFSKDSTPIKYVVSTVNMTQIPDCSLIDQLNLKSGDKTSMLKWKMFRILICWKVSSSMKNIIVWQLTWPQSQFNSGGGDYLI
jgi:hypothetical protein